MAEPGSLRKQVTAHYLLHWGTPETIEVRTPGLLEIALLPFAPSGERTSWRIATNGMSALLQSAPDTRFRTEIYASAAADAAWIHELLGLLAEYPVRYGEPLCELDTLPLVHPIRAGASVYEALLLAPPGPDEPESLGAVAGTGEPLLIHRVVPLTQSEYGYACARGSEELWLRLRTLGPELLIDSARPACV